MQKQITADPASAPGAAAAPQAPLPLPTRGGCWVRNADGSLSVDTDEHPPETAPAAAELAKE